MLILGFDIQWVGFGFKRLREWQLLALQGNKIGAIKNLLVLKNKKYPDDLDPRRIGLFDAKEMVELYIRKNGKEF